MILIPLLQIINITVPTLLVQFIIVSYLPTPIPPLGFPGGLVVKNLPANSRGTGSVPGFRRSPGEGNDNPMQYFCVGNPMDRGACQATVHGLQKKVGHNLAIKQQYQSLGVLDSIYWQIFRESQSIGFSPFSAFSFLSPIVFFLCTDFCCLRIFILQHNN